MGDADTLSELRTAVEAIITAGEQWTATSAEFRPTDTGLELRAGQDGEPIASIDLTADYAIMAAVCNMWLEGQRERMQLRADIAEIDVALQDSIDHAEAVERQLDGLGDVIDTVRPGMQEEALLEATLGALTELEVVDSAWVGFPTSRRAASSTLPGAGRRPSR
jgi:hypothetical protein